MSKLSDSAIVVSAVLAAFVWSSSAMAGTVNNATIGAVAATNYGSVSGPDPFFVYLSAPDANIGCNSSNLPVFAIDAATPSGRAMIAVVLSAQAAGQPISIAGTGNCNIWGLVESVNSLTVY